MTLRVGALQASLKSNSKVISFFKHFLLRSSLHCFAYKH